MSDNEYKRYLSHEGASTSRSANNQNPNFISPIRGNRHPNSDGSSVNSENSYNLRSPNSINSPIDCRSLATRYSIDNERRKNGDCWINLGKLLIKVFASMFPKN